MKNKTNRIIAATVVLVLVVACCFSVRKGMVLFIENHSLWHYVVRFFLITLCIAVFLDGFRFLSSNNPLEVFGDVGLESAQFKISNVVKRLFDITLSIVILMFFFRF